MFDQEASSSESESEDDGKQLTGRARWLKKTPTTTQTAKETKREAKKNSAQRSTKKKEYSELSNLNWAAKKHPSILDLGETITVEDIQKKKQELLSMMGKKNSKDQDILLQLEVLAKAGRIFGPEHEIPLLMLLVSSIFRTVKSIDEYLNHQQWRTCFRSLMRIMSYIEMDKSLFLGVLGSNEIANSSVINEGEKDLLAFTPPAGSTEVKVFGSLESFVLRLEDEYTKSLQQINPHTQVNLHKTSFSKYPYQCRYLTAFRL